MEVLRGKFIAMSTHIRKLEQSQINNLMINLRLSEKQEQANPKCSKWKEIKIRAEIKELGSKK
jgi:hypothetical protein